MYKRNVLNSPRLLELKKKKRDAFMRKILILFFGLAVVMAFLVYVSRIERLNISRIEVAGNKVVDTEAIHTAVQTEISGNYFWLFPKTNIFLYPKSSIKNALGAEFTRLKNISLALKDSRTLVVTAGERTGAYIWCGEAPRAEVQNPMEQCYFLDTDGYIFDQAPYFSGEVYFKFYGPAELGSYFSKENFKELVSFKEALEDMELKPVMLYADGSGDITIFLSKGKILPTGPKIIFTAGSSLETVAENLKAALDTEPLKSGLKEKYSTLEYIDLRFGNKVYYKFK